MDPIGPLKKLLNESTDEQLNSMIPKGALKLSEEHITMVSFVFWLVYLAETDLNDSLVRAWKTSGPKFSPEVQMMAEEKLQELLAAPACSACGTPGLGRKINIAEPKYFSDKIRLHQALMGKTGRTRLSWKLNDLRNQLGHTRIDDLSYGGISLTLRETKLKILSDYFDTVYEVDVSKADIWNSLPPEQQRDILEAIRELDPDQVKNADGRPFVG